MKVAVMQPYFMPYLGYFQLINAVDTFVFYDDVSFIKGGWINRNRILLNNEKYTFTVSLEKSSSSKLICYLNLDKNKFERFTNKFLRSLDQSYKKAPYWKETMKIVESILNSNVSTISELSIRSVEIISAYLNMKTKFEISSQTFSESKGLDKGDRLINISKKLKANTYINPQGGKELYQKEYFNNQNIELLFIENKLKPYKQFTDSFISGLSIIDALMFNSKDELKEMLNDYTLK